MSAPCFSRGPDARLNYSTNGVRRMRHRQAGILRPCSRGSGSRTGSWRGTACGSSYARATPVSRRKSRADSQSASPSSGSDSKTFTTHGPSVDHRYIDHLSAGQDDEMWTRYSNNPTVLDDLRRAREAMLSPDEDDEPELGGERRANGRRWAWPNAWPPMISRRSWAATALGGPPGSWPRASRSASNACSAGPGAGGLACHWTDLPCRSAAGVRDTIVGDWRARTRVVKLACLFTQTSTPAESNNSSTPPPPYH